MGAHCRLMGVEATTSAQPPNRAYPVSRGARSRTLGLRASHEEKTEKIHTEPVYVPTEMGCIEAGYSSRISCAILGSNQ